ncbi:hypothetical protein K469DRAFT_554134 [Zopfia rhizophila CBS 207.26]|uniref:Uncharacterized protein n=1 Tax=Zopfia rhizophila CBS 207.26 TaxID=1314779 RepID=A0A6A6EQC4_9PEZI|nr:hypothetical protein K469DRAFT_554134 [Zopfia rhizophila CBS 207.26]
MSANPTKSPPIAQRAASPRSPQLPHFEDPPEERAEDHQAERNPPDAEDEDEIPYPETTSEQTLLPPPNFNPFFTIIEDSTTGEHYHPYVHYVFADDDPVIVTAAAMRSLGLDDTQYLPRNTPEQENGQELGDRAEDKEGQAESPLPPPIPGVKERYLIIDVAADGQTILDAQSLSSEWQITGNNVRPAPSFDEEPGDQGMMLRIEGVEVPTKNKGKGKGNPGGERLAEAKEKAGGDVFGAMDGLVKGVEGRLEIAGKITGARDGVRDSERTVLGPDEKGKRRASEI